MTKLSQILKFKKELFYCSFNFKTEIDLRFLCKLFRLFEEGYPNITVKDDYGSFAVKPENIPFLDLNFLPEQSNTKRYYISGSLYFQYNRRLSHLLIQDAFELTIGKSISAPENYLLLDVYANVFTDQIYILEGNGHVQYDIPIAAAKNRAILAQLIKNLEIFLDTSVDEALSDYHLIPNSVYTYGIREDAKMIKP